MGRARHRPPGGSPRARRATPRRSIRRSARTWTGSSGRPFRPRHWPGPQPARSAPPPSRLPPQLPAPQQGSHCAWPQGASPLDAFADKPWRASCPTRQPHAPRGRTLVPAIDANRPARTEQLFKVNDKMQMRRTSRQTDGSRQPGDAGWRALKKNVRGSLPAGHLRRRPPTAGPRDEVAFRGGSDPLGEEPAKAVQPERPRDVGRDPRRGRRRGRCRRRSTAARST